MFNFQLNSTKMKRQVLYLAMATLVMASCSKNETLDINEGRGIGFHAMSNAGTRASEVTNNTLTDFWVTALYNDNGSAYFSDVKFSGSQNNFYTSTPSYNWPSGELLFHAIYPQKSDLDGTLTLSKEAQKLENFSVKSSIAAQKDLVYAQATGSKADESTGVSLKFNHMLSQISVEVKSESQVYVYKVKGVVIGQIPSTGSLTDMSAKTWSSTLTNKVIYEDDCPEFTMNGTYRSVMNTTNGNAMLIPQTLIAWDVKNDKDNSTNEGAYIGVKIQISTKDGNCVYPRNKDLEYAYACVPINTEWEAGKHYVYKLDFSNGAGYVDPEIPVNPDPENPDPDQPGDEILGGGIKFTVSVSEWTPQGGQSIETPME